MGSELYRSGQLIGHIGGGQTFTINWLPVMCYQGIVARPLRIEYPGAWYHITCRGNERKTIFQNDADRRTFLDILATSLNTFNAALHCYVLMTNHFHLIIETHEANLGKLMQRFNTSYTVYYNRHHNRSGHLYQGRYNAILIDADSYLLELSRYVHLNPIRIKKYSQSPITEKETLIESYRWSSYPSYINKKKRQPFVNYEMILSMVGSPGGQDASVDYKRFVLSGISDDLSDTYWDDIRWQALKRTTAFAESIYEKYIRHRREMIPQENSSPVARPSMTIEEIAHHVSSICGVPEEKLYCKRSAYAAERSFFMEFCCRYMNSRMSLTDIGKELGDVSVAAMSQNRRRLHERMWKDKSLREQYETIGKKLA